MADYNTTSYNKPKTKEGTKPLIGKPVEGVSVQRIEVSLADETINKLSEAFAERIHVNLVDVEPFTAAELRIFLEAMAREETACKKVDRQGNNKSLVNVCKEIERKVKCALWTI